MRALSDAPANEFEPVRFVLTDMDETLTWQGRLSAAAYTSLEQLQSAGIRVIPVTAAPAGWCDQMARMWPVDGVIGENGGLFFRRTADGHGIEHHYWHADDQPFRLTSLAFARPADPVLERRIVNTLRQAGADATVNNLWVLGWLGGYDKLTMTRRTLAQHYGVDIDREREAILYSGDSTNDAPMFAFFKHTVGVSTVRQYLDHLPVAPRWVTLGPGGAGFVEMAQAVFGQKSL